MHSFLIIYQLFSKNIHLILFSALFILITGCNYCDNKGDQKCEDNRIMICDGVTPEHALRWEVELNCGKYNATCETGSYSTTWLEFLEPIADTDFSPMPNSKAACVVDDVECEFDTDSDLIDDGPHCSKDNQSSYVCDPKESLPIINSLNDYDKQYCIEKNNGLIGYSDLDGACDDEEMECLAYREYRVCENGMWTKGECSLDSNKSCQVDTDPDSLLLIPCQDAEPCTETTGSYSICSSDLPHNKSFTCRKTDNKGWYWMITWCAENQVCVEEDTEGVCRYVSD